jgi:hypothetical protein
VTSLTRRAAIGLAAAAIAAACYISAPPPAQILTPVAAGAVPIRGVIHVHTRRSDGSGTVEEVAAAAARAGLKFVVFTDHGDATREPAPPIYLDGVLCIDAVEISTEGGHLVALGLGRSPYRLGGEPRDVVEDVKRLGGTAIAAHPGSPKPELRWTDWTTPIDGLEWLNADSAWRDEHLLGLARVLLAYPFRRAEALATMLGRPADVLRRWDSLTRQRRLFAVAGADAHARLGLRSSGDPAAPGASLHLPAYESLFRTFSISLPQLQLTGDARRDGAAVLGEIAAGHSFAIIDALATPGTLSFSATSGSHRASGGDILPLDGPVNLHVSSNAPDGAVTVLIKDGNVIASVDGRDIEQTVAASRAVYRVEVRLPQRSAGAPWLLSNPIYVGSWDAAAPSATVDRAARSVETQYADGPATGWSIETSRQAVGKLDVIGATPGTQLLMRFALAGAEEDGPYVALAMPAGEALSRHDRIVFMAHSDRPMRMSVQLRVANGGMGERWRRSVYLDATPREISVLFDDMTAVDPGTPRRPDLAAVRSVLFVVDTVNAKAGDSGQVWLDDVRYER